MIPHLTAERDSEDGPRQSVIFHRGWIWLPNFLVRQTNWPIRPKDRAHFRIITEIRDQALRFRGVEAYAKMKAEMEEIVATGDDPEQPRARVSREDLKRVPKDWDAIREKCMASLHPNFRHDNALRERFEAWWDHRLTIGDPLELPMWREFQTVASGFSPRVITEAITYAISQGVKTVNFAMAKKIADENPVPQSAPAGGAVAVPDPDGWREAFATVFDGAEPPSCFWRLAKSRRELLYQHDPGLRDRAKAIDPDA